MLPWQPGSPVRSCPDPAHWIRLATHLLYTQRLTHTLHTATHNTAEALHAHCNTQYRRGSACTLQHTIPQRLCMHTATHNTAEALHAHCNTQYRRGSACTLQHTIPQRLCMHTATHNTAEALHAHCNTQYHRGSACTLQHTIPQRLCMHTATHNTTETLHAHCNTQYHRGSAQYAHTTHHRNSCTVYKGHKLRGVHTYMQRHTDKLSRYCIHKQYMFIQYIQYHVHHTANNHYS